MALQGLDGAGPDSLNRHDYYSPQMVQESRTVRCKLTPRVTRAPALAAGRHIILSSHPVTNHHPSVLLDLSWSFEHESANNKIITNYCPGRIPPYVLVVVASHPPKGRVVVMMLLL